MGQGQEYHARKMMTECMAGGEQKVSNNYAFEVLSMNVLLPSRWLGFASERASLIELLCRNN